MLKDKEGKVVEKVGRFELSEEEVLVKSWNDLIDKLCEVQDMWDEHREVYQRYSGSIGKLPVKQQGILLMMFHKMRFEHFLDFLTRYARTSFKNIRIG